MGSITPTEVAAVSGIDALVALWIDAKRAEAEANAQRVALEERIVAAVGQREEGSESHKLANGMTLTVTGKLTYKCTNLVGLRHALEQAGAASNEIPVKTEPKFDETGAKWLRANAPHLWAAAASFVTVAPAKTSISVKA